MNWPAGETKHVRGGVPAPFPAQHHAVVSDSGKSQHKAPAKLPRGSGSETRKKARAACA